MGSLNLPLAQFLPGFIFSFSKAGHRQRRIKAPFRQPGWPGGAGVRPDGAGSQSGIRDAAGAAARRGRRSVSQVGRRPGVQGQWWVEMAHGGLMVGMLAAIVGILAAHGGRPLPEWPFAVSISTAVSILSTVLKTCAAIILAEGVSDLEWRWFQELRPLRDFALFDSARRGPWGCVRRPRPADARRRPLHVAAHPPLRLQAGAPRRRRRPGRHPPARHPLYRGGAAHGRRPLAVRHAPARLHRLGHL